MGALTLPGAGDRGQDTVSVGCRDTMAQDNKQGGALMISQIGCAYLYWFKAIFKPGEVFDTFRSDPKKLEISLWILFFFAIFHSITALILYFAQVLPLIDPWIPIAKEKYYLYQTFWTIPWRLATAFMLAGIAHVMAMLGRDNPSPFTFKDALVVNSIAWVIPSFVLMWLPETFVVPFFGGVPWPRLGRFTAAVVTRPRLAGRAGGHWYEKDPRGQLDSWDSDRVGCYWGGLWYVSAYNALEPANRTSLIPRREHYIL